MTAVGGVANVEFTLLIGVVLAFAALILGYSIEGGSITSLFLISPVIVVLGGTLSAVIASFSLKDIINALKSIAGSFSKRSVADPTKMIAMISSLSEICRKDGILKLEGELQKPEMKGDEFLFLKEGLILIIEGRPEDEIQYILESDIRSYALQKQIEISVFEAAGGYSPTMGVIGTVMGLVQVLSNMSDAAELAASIATAFVATLYGVVFANIIYLPMANKLKSILKRQKVQKEMTVDGVCMIASGVGTRSIQNRLSLYYQAFPDGKKKYREGIEK